MSKWYFENGFAIRPKTEKELEIGGMYEPIVHIDVTSPYSGTDMPIGCAALPVNNLADAEKIAERIGGTIKEMKEQEYDMFDKLRGTIHKSYNCNFHYESLEWNTQIWIKEMCKLIEKMIAEKE